MTDIVTEALARNNPALSHEVGSQVGDKLAKELNYAMREREDLEEARFKRLDEALRDMQKNNKSRAEAAAAQAPVVKLKKKRRVGAETPRFRMKYKEKTKNTFTQFRLRRRAHNEKRTRRAGPFSGLG